MSNTPISSEQPAGTGEAPVAPAAAQESAPESTSGERPEQASPDDELSEPEDDFGPPFIARSFGGELVWADCESYTAKVLRVRAGQKVLISTRGRKDMVALLTGGRACVEIVDEHDSDRVELLPASPISIAADREYRLVAITDVELFVSYAPL